MPTTPANIYTDIYKPPVITPETLGSSPTLPTVPPVNTGNYSSILTGTNDAIESDLSTDTPTDATPYTDKTKELLDKITGLFGQDTGKAAYAQGQLDASGATALSKRQKELGGQINALTSETEAAKLALEKNAGPLGISTTFLNRQLNATTREAAIKALTLKAEYDVNAGNLQSATESAQRAVDLRYGDIEAEIDQNTKLLQLYAPFMTAEQKAEADKVTQANEEKKQGLADKKKSQTDLINFAQESGDTAIASAILKLDPNSSTFNEDLADLQSKINIKANTEITEVNGRKLLVDSDTGATIKDLGPTTASGGEGDDILSVTEAIALGVPYGTKKSEAFGLKPLSAASRTTLNGIKSAQPLVDTIQKLSDSLKLATSVSGTAVKGALLTTQGLSPATAAGQYNAQKNAFLSLIVRALGEKGTLATKDIDRIKSSLPGFFDTQESAKNKLENLKGIMKDVYDQALSGYYESSDTFGDTGEDKDPLKLGL